MFNDSFYSQEEDMIPDENFEYIPKEFLKDYSERDIKILLENMEHIDNKIYEIQLEKEFCNTPKNNDIRCDIGPKIDIKENDVNLSFDSLEYDLCFDLDSKLFNEETLNNNSVLNRSLNKNKNYSPWEIKLDNSRQQYNPSHVTTEKNEKKFITENSEIEKKNERILCCNSKKIKRIKTANNSLYSNNILNTQTKKSTNLSNKSLKLNDSLSKQRKKNMQQHPSLNVKKNTKSNENCRCIIF